MGIHKFIAVIVFISLIASAILMGIFIRQQQDESFKRFISLHKAGIYQGVIMAPLFSCDRCHKADKNHNYQEGWLIAGIGNEGTVKLWEGK